MNNRFMKMNALIVSALLLLACDSNRPEVLGSEKLGVYAMPSESSPALDVKIADVQTNLPSVENKLIRNGGLDIQVSDVHATRKALDQLLKTVGAHSASETMNHSDERLEYQLTLRVPAAKFDTLLAQLEKLADRVDHKNTSVEDVTSEFIDVEARLKTKKELESRYGELLKQAKTVADLLAIENQMATTRGEIESMEGRLTYLNNQVAYSTIYFTYYEVVGTDFGFGGKLASSLREGWENLLVFLIFLIRVWPFTLLVGLGGFWVVRKVRRRAA